MEEDDPDVPTIKFTEDIELINEKSSSEEETDKEFYNIEECPLNELPSHKVPKKMTVSGTGLEFAHHLKMHDRK